MLKFAICDDKLSVLERLEKMLDCIITKHNFPAEIALSTNSYEELLDFIETNTIDVLILDINLKSDLSGLQIARENKRKK